jgi:hypothetical protein
MAAVPANNLGLMFHCAAQPTTEGPDLGHGDRDPVLGLDQVRSHTSHDMSTAAFFRETGMPSAGDQLTHPLGIAHEWIISICLKWLKGNHLLHKFLDFVADHDRVLELPAATILEETKRIRDSIADSICLAKQTELQNILLSVPGWVQHTLGGRILKVGYLLKADWRDKSWSSRYFVLSDKTIEYHRRLEKHDPVPFRISGTRMLSDVLDVQKCSKKRLKGVAKSSRRNCFEIATRDRIQAINAQADSEVSAACWAQHIMEVQDVCDRRVPKDHSATHAVLEAHAQKQSCLQSQIRAVVQRLLERQMLGTERHILVECAARSSTVPGEKLDRKIKQMGSLPQSASVFGISEQLRSPTSWRAAVVRFNAMSEAKLPFELLHLLLLTKDAIYSLFEAEHGNGKILGGDDFLPIFIFVISKSRVHNLSAIAEFMLRLGGDAGEAAYFSTTLVASIQHICSIPDELIEADQAKLRALESTALTPAEIDQGAMVQPGETTPGRTRRKRQNLICCASPRKHDRMPNGVGPANTTSI